jgi:hypothetical protein
MLQPRLNTNEREIPGKQIPRERDVPIPCRLQPGRSVRMGPPVPNH